MKFPIQNKHLGTVQVQISEDDRDLAVRSWRLAGGNPESGGPAQYVCDSKGSYLHRVVACRMGLIPEVKGSAGGRWKVSIDHHNGDKLDNRRSNLRLRTRPQQMSNPNDGVNSKNTSGVRGVSRTHPKRPKPWMAYATVAGRTRYLGLFATVEEAAAARRAWDEAHKE